MESAYADMAFFDCGVLHSLLLLLGECRNRSLLISSTVREDLENASELEPLCSYLSLNGRFVISFTTFRCFSTSRCIRNGERRQFHGVHLHLFYDMLTFFLQMQQNLAKLKDGAIDGLETKHFVLVHGGGFGAWCWYKTIALLEESGYKVTAIDLMGSGIHSSDTNAVTSLSQYVNPLIDFLDKLADAEKVILVGHDFGGACISYAMELFPSKVSKAIFIAATMLTDGQSALEIFSQQVDCKDLMQQAQIFVYANGNNNPPTAIDLNKSLLKELLFNQSPTKDVALASVSMRAIPFAPVLEKLCLSDDKYGSVRRFYIETTEDNAIPISSQEQMSKAAPPEQIFRLRGADHSPFFSKPQALHRYFVEISKIP